MQAILVGFMGSGKTTVGQLLAKKLQTSHRDLDALIVEKAGKSIQQIFDDEGEGAFRRLEHAVLKEALTGEGILSTGGGTPIQPANFDLLKASRVPVVLLDVAPETIVQRLSGDNARPLVKKMGLAGLVDLKNQRDSRYHEVSDVEIKTDAMSPSRVAATIVAELSLTPPVFD